MRHFNNARIVFLVLFTLLICSVSAAQSDPVGRWKGVIQIPATPLDVDIKLFRADDGSGAGTITIPAQGAKDLPLDVSVFESSALTFSIRGIPGEPTFEGVLSADGNRITGDFSQATARFKFTLDRAVSAADEAAANLAGLEETVRQALGEFKVPGIAIGIVKDGEVVLEQGFGHRNVASELPVTENTLFAIGSSTKAFTTAVLGSLVDEGSIDWDTPVREYLPEFRLWDEHATAALTVRDLVTHRSGMPRHDLMWYGASLDREALIERLRFLQPYRDIREVWHYQNLMYLTAGVLTEEVTGASWEDNVRKRILEPLEMNRSNFSVEESQKDDDHALPYREDEGEILPIPFRNIDAVGPAGSINSSIHEMLAWVRLHLDGGTLGNRKILNTSTLREMHTPQMKVEGYPSKPDLLLGSYGLGWFIRAYRGHYQVEHGGNIDGFSALVSLFPLDNLGIVILVNANGSALPTLLERHIADLMLGLEPRSWLAEGLAEVKIAKTAGKKAEARRGSTRVENTTPAHPIEAYAGDYEHPAYGTMSVTVDKGQLIADMHGISTPLTHWNYETFRGDEGEEWPSLDGLKFTFVTDEDGNIAGLSVPLDVEVDAIVFDRAVDQRLLDPDYLKKFAGTYDLEGAPQRIAVEIRGSTLVLSIPGQPPLELAPNAGGTFDLKGYAGFSVKFVENSDGVVTGLESRQPNGVYLATRVQE